MTPPRRAVTPAGSPTDRFVPAFLAVAVAAFSGLWRAGALVIDGPGMALYVRLARDHLLADGRVPYWMTEMWAGGPVWALVPSLPVFMLVPLAAVVGSDVAVKIAILAFQVVGGWGAFVLARSLWGRTPAAVLAGLIYTLHPVFVAHGALAGAETSAAVMAATPWVAWSLRRGLRGEGTRYVVGAGLVSALAVLHQAEYAYALAVLSACMLAVELGRVRNGETSSSAAQVVGRAGAVVAVSVGAVAHWLFPFLALGDSFVLSPPALVQGELFGNAGASVASELGIFLDRSGGLAGTMSFDRLGVRPELFYLSWVCVGLTLVTVAVLARRTDDVYLTAVLVASAIGVWMSSGAVPMAASGPADRHQVVQLVLTAGGAGLLLVAFLKRLHLRRALPVVLAAGVVFLAVLPYLTPVVNLREATPLLASLRVPRFYLIAPLGLALAAAYPVTLLESWARALPDRSPGRRAPALGTMAALAVAAGFLVDIVPYRSFYRLRPPASDAAYAEVARTLAAEGGASRVSVSRLDPRSMASALRAGRDLSVGWPHSVAGREVWRVAAEPYLSPPGYRQAAYGLSATEYLTVEQPVGSATANETIPEVSVLRNPRVLPLVRAYDQAVVVGERTLAPVLAASLAHRNVAVVAAGPDADSVGGIAIADGEPLACDGSPSPSTALQGELAMACALDRWIGGLFAGYQFTAIGNGVGAAFPALAGDLQGISVWLDRPAGRAELALYDMADDGVTLGSQRARGQAATTDEYGLATFGFDRIPDSAGRRFAFVITCPGCPTDAAPRMITGRALRAPGNLIDGDRLVTDRTAAFAPVHQRVARAEPSATRVRSARPAAGRWRIETTGSRPSLVVVAESSFPGWRAEVDGRAAPVVQADGAFVGVPVEAGDHVITLGYATPAAATAGRLVTGATLLAIVVVGGRRRQRRLVARDAEAPVPAPTPRPVADAAPGADPDRPEVPEPVPAALDQALQPERSAAEPAPATDHVEVEPSAVEPEPAAGVDEPDPEEPPPGVPVAEEATPAAEEDDTAITIVELVEPSVPKRAAQRRRRRP